MGEMSMWTRMPGQTWPGFAAALFGMWMTMMVPMMAPPFAVMLWRYRAAAATSGATRLGSASVLVTLGYFFVWSGIGIVVVPALAVVSAGTRSRTGVAALQDGVDLGLRCARSCAPLMTMALVLGGLDVRVMVAVTLTITAERLWESRCTRAALCRYARADRDMMRLSLSAWIHRCFARSSTTR